jgi:hypothetical protein
MAALAAVGVVAVAGCGGRDSTSSIPELPSSSATASPAGPSSSPSPSASLDPKAQAYADAEKAYRDYSAALDRVRQSGGKDPGQAQQFTRRDGRAFVFTQSLAKGYQANGWRTLEGVAIRSVKPQSFAPATSKAGAQVVLMACEQTAKSGVVDKNGKPAVKLPKGDNGLFRDTVHLVQPSKDSPWVVDYFEVVKVDKC